MSKAIDFYDYDSFKDCAVTARAVTGKDGVLFNDGQNGAYAYESLMGLSKTIHKFIPPEATFMDLKIGIDRTGGYLNSITTLREAIEGDYRREGTTTQGDGKISLNSDRTTTLIEGYSAESDYTLTELEQAKMEERNIHSSLVGGHNSKFLETIDDSVYLMLFSPVSGFKRKDNGKTWRSYTDPAKGDIELTSIIRDAILTQRSGLNRAYWCDTVVISPELLLRIQSSDYSPYIGVTIKSKIEQSLGVKFVDTFRAVGAGAGKSEVLACISTKMNAMNIRIPKRLKFSPTWRLGDTFHFQGSFRTGGLEILDKRTGYIVEGL